MFRDHVVVALLDYTCGVEGQQIHGRCASVCSLENEVHLHDDVDHDNK